MDWTDYALQGTSSVLTLASMWLIGSKHRLGPRLAACSEVLWIVMCCYGKLWGLLPVSFVAMVLHARNIRLWSKTA